MHFLGLNTTIYAEKNVQESNLWHTTGRYQKLDCGKAWKVLKHKVSSYINAVQSKIKSKIESIIQSIVQSIVQSRVHSPGFVPTPFSSFQIDLASG